MAFPRGFSDFSNAASFSDRSDGWLDGDAMWVIASAKARVLPRLMISLCLRRRYGVEAAVGSSRKRSDV